MDPAIRYEFHLEVRKALPAGNEPYDANGLLALAPAPVPWLPWHRSSPSRCTSKFQSAAPPRRPVVWGSLS